MQHCQWTLSTEKLYQFLDINKIGPTIKFTLKHSSPFYCSLKDEHDCWCHGIKSIPFLATKLYIEDGKITTDLYRKLPNRCMYLLPSSCHPAHISNNIPYSLAYRIVRICSKPELRDAQFLKLRDFLLCRDYNLSFVDFAVVRAKAITREVALKKVEKKEKPDGVIISISFNPLLHHTETLDSHGPGSLDEVGF